MKPLRSTFVWFTLAVIGVGLLGIGSCVPLPVATAQAQANVLPPAEAVAQAWQNAVASGTYAYYSTIDQTTYPAPMLSNAGRAPRQENLALAGRFDRWAETLDFTLWRDGSFDPNTGLSLRVENGAAYARTGNGQWEAVDDFTASFAPGGDPLAFLTGITNIQEGGTQTYQLGSEQLSVNSNQLSVPSSINTPTLHSSLSTLHYTAYTFDLNGPAFATYMRKQLEKELAARGELPRGLNLETPEIYQQMTGQGTLWVDANGLPARLQLVLDLGVQANGERVTASLQTDFSEFDLARLKQAATPLNVDPSAWWQAQWQNVDRKTVREYALNLSVVLVVLLGSYVLSNAWRSRHVYRMLVLAVIFGMIITPLIDAQNVYAFTQTQQTKQTEHAIKTAAAEANAQAQAAYKNQWDPHVNPLEQLSSKQLEVNSEQPTASTSHFSLLTDYASPLAPSATITSTDTDNDGLSDADEANWYTCAYTGASYCSGVTNTTDSDGDGLTDGQEVNGLGTLPTYADTDGDTISDTLEVRGFTYNGVKWYLDPNNVDTNSDGLLDSADCPVWSEGTAAYNPNGLCPDTDDDGTPNVFDDDNDGDGVADADDTSPNVVSGPYTKDNPFKLAINNLQTNKPVLLSLQFRPTNPNHLTYSGRVLDWPADDTQGQIIRKLDTTFASTTNPDIRTSDDRAANGDVRVIPILEITMPYSPGHYANLPVKPAYLGISRTLGLTIGQWLNPTELDPYAISIKDVDATSGWLTAYVPIHRVASSTGDNTVAFSAQMVYSPTQASWGAAQEFRVIWLVQMITDACVDLQADPATCAREEELMVIQDYAEEWELTGLEVSEEHGLDIALMYENPAQDLALKVDHQLWAYGWNMGNNFINGRDCDSIVNDACVGNGQRDVTVANLATVVPTWSTSNYVAVSTYHYRHSGYFGHIMMTETKALLNSVFAAYTATTYPTFMVAQEINRRSANLGDGVATFSGSQLTFNFASVVKQTATALSWSSYQYVAGAWANMPAEDYLTYLDAQLAFDDYFKPADSSAESAAEAEGKRIWAQSYYVTLYKGLVGLAAVNNNVIWTFDDSERPDLMFIAPSDVNFGALSSVARTVARCFYEAVVSKLTAYYNGTQVYSLWHYFSEAFQKRISRYGIAKYSRLEGWAGRVLSGMTIFAVGAALAVAGATLYAIGYFTDNKTLMKVGAVMLSVSSLILETAKAISLVLRYRSLVALGDFTSLATLATKLRWSAVIGLMITLLVIWGMFTAQVLTGAVKPGTVQFEILLAYTIAATIIAIISFILVMAFPIAGSILLGLLALIDIILELAGERTITDRVTQAIADYLYDVDFVVENLDDTARLQLGGAQIAFVNPALGFRVDNGLYYTTVVTNTIESNNGPADTRRATFRYVMHSDDSDQHSGLDQDQMHDDWVLVQTSPTQLRVTVSAGLTTPVMLNAVGIGTGVNRNLDGYLYLTESYAAPYEGCWQVSYAGFTADVKCTWYSYEGSSHLNLGADVYFDILPATIDEFVAMSWNPYGAPSFPAQRDQDADSLLSLNQGGADPDDQQPDTDGDGLSDKQELLYALPAQDADGDDDGLSDREELAYYLTDPLDGDTDDDGLPDYTEVKTGWLTVYGYTGTTPLLTRVWSDPNFTDADEDTLSDLEEFTFGFNPKVKSDPSIIKDIIGFGNMGVAETDAALALWRFEEGEAVAAFADSSGANHNLGCNRAAGECPASDVSGHYGGAIRTDGNDYLTATIDLDLSGGEFTIASWVYSTITDTAFHGFMGYQSGTTATRAPSMWVTQQNQIHAGFGDGANWNQITTGAVITPNAWQHVATTYDGNTFNLYVNGALISSTTAFAGRVPYSVAQYHVGRVDNYFQGSLDEAAVFSRALSASEVYALMRGRYNPNDQLLAPGQNLRYHTTITNTHASQSANGFLVGTNTYAAPAIAVPNTALRFEDTDYVYRLTNDVGESYSLACPNDGTCPTTAGNGRHGQALDFDGANDALTYPALSDIVSEHSLAFWLKLEALPVSGTVAQLLATDRTANGSLSILVDANGRLNFTIAGMGTHTSTTTLATGTWVHVAFAYQKISGTSAVSRLYLNGTQNSVKSNYTVAYELLLGPGTLGNNAARTAPLNGQLDEFVVYDNQILAGSANSAGYIDVQEVMNGNYWLYESIGNVADVTPTALFRFGDELGYDGTLHYDTNGSAENAYCSSPNCPAVTAGFSGNGVVFDGVNDHLSTDTTRTTADQGVNFRIKVGAWPTTGTLATILDTTSGTRPVDVSLNSTGHLVVSSSLGTLTSTGVLTPGTWFLVDTYFDSTFNTCSTWNYDLYIYINGGFDSKQTYWCQSSGNHSYQVTFGPGRIGRTASNTNPFSGTLDNFNTNTATYNFEVNDPAAVEVLNHLGGDNAACTEHVNCPALTTGKYGAGLAFDGSNYLTLENESEFDYNALSVGAWIKVAPGGFTATWQAIVTKGDGAWRLHRFNNTSRISFGTTGLSNADLQSVSNLDDGQWHYIMGVYDGAAKYLYVDGVLQNYVAVTGKLAKNDHPVLIGENAQQTGRKFVGAMDEIILLPEAVYTAGVRALMNTRYPPIIIPDSFITYTTGALTSTVVSGTAQVESTAHTSVQRFQQEAEAALALQSAITMPVVDNSSALLKGYFPFEEVPGVTTFENLISANDMRCAGDNCPAAGLRGVADRAVHFDGVDDVLTTTVETNPDGLTSYTIAAWVKADRGTLVDGLASNLLTGMQLDTNRLYFRVRTGTSGNFSYTRYTLNFDLPENEWTHLVATIHLTNQVASIYMNGALVVTSTFSYPGGAQLAPMVVAIGANRFGGDYLHGYLDDLRIYNQPLTTGQVQTLYAQSTPAMRFEFDEDGEATTYADATPYKAVGYPNIQTCADFSLQTATVNTYVATTDNVYVQLGTEALLYDTITNAVANATRNLDSVICASTPMTVAIVTNTGATATLGTATLNPTVAGTFTQTFSSGGNSLTLTWLVGAAYDQANPAPGTDGQIGNTGLFDGVESYIGISPTLTTLTNSVAGLTNTFTLMGWINPDTFPGYQWILSAGRGASNNGYGFGLRDNNLLFTLFNVGERRATNYALDTGIWQHVAVVFDGSYDAYFYVDGQLVQTIAGAQPITRNTDDPLYIGASTRSTDGSFYEHFNGQIDELAVYSRTLSGAEIYSVYLRELRWYRDRSTSYLTIDDDAPTSELLSNFAYRANAYTQLAAGATDPTSHIALLDFGLKAPSAVTYTWRSAPACLDTASTWCPAFDPSTLDGEGAYQLQFRAVDGVGNESLSSVYTLLVDATPPTASSAYAGNWINSNPVPQDELSWWLPLSGTVSDPNIGGAPGSGVYTDSVKVSLVNGRGEILGGAAQRAVVTGTSWSLNYAATGLRPSGVYTIQVYAEDNVGNAMTAGLRSSTLQSANAPQTAGTVRLDERAPAAQFATWAYPTATLTTTAVLTGVVGDYADWGGEQVQFHLEENSGSVFYDYSGNAYLGRCITCPVKTAGVFGNARAFTATQRAAITVTASAEFSFTNATLAAWVKPTWTSGSNGYSPAILAVRSLTATHLSWHLRDNYTGLQLWNGSVTRTLTTTLTPGQWYHLALVMDDGAWTGYVNGLPIGTVTQTFGTGMALPLNIGASTGAAEFFTGSLDEVTVFGRALAADEIYALAQKEVTGVNKAEVWLETFTFTGTAPAPNWQTATLGSPNALLTTWAYTLPGGLEDFYQINLRAQDAFSNTSSNRTIWRGIVDQLAPRVTFTATHRGGGYAAQTVYTFTVNDKFLDPLDLTQPCAASSLVYTTYLADEVRASGVSGNGCRVNGHVTGPVTLTACDIVGHCTSQTITLTAPAAVSAVSILTPTASSTISTTPVTIAGGAYNPSGVLTVTVNVDGNPLAVLPFSGTVTNTLWSTNAWAPVVSKTYTLTAVMNTVAGGPYTDTITVVYAPQDACFAEITGDNVTDFSSYDAGAIRAALQALTTTNVLKLAGNCVGVSSGQVAAITRTLTVRGGYTPTNWLQSYPLTQPTTLDAQGAGRVLSITAPATLENLWLTNGYLTNTVGGGLHTTQPITLTGLTFYSNTVTGTTGLRQGGGAYLGQLAQISGTTFLSNTAFAEGGGVYINGALTLTNGSFQNNRIFQTTADGAGLFVSGVALVDGTQFIGNIGFDRGGGAYFGNLATVRNITATQNQAAWGGGLLVGGATGFAATVTNSVFVSNTTTTYGGGLFAIGTLTLTNSSFISNTADAAGGGAQIQNVAHIANTTFISNSVRTSNGGGLYLSLTGWLTNTTFSANTTSSSGGGLLASAAVTLTQVIFDRNMATITGGGAHFNGDAIISNTIFSANRANSGGGAYFNNANARQLSNVRLTGNSASTGPALYVNNTSSMQLLHTTIASPTLASGAAVYVVSGTVSLTNTLIASHTVGLQRTGGTLNENYTLFSNVTTPYNGGVIAGGNSFTGTAAFYDTTAYTLTAVSQALNAGTNAGVTTDYFGDPRPQSTGFDIGYDEAPFASPHFITPTAGVGGVITPGTPQLVADGSALTFTIAPNIGYAIAGVWVDGVAQGAIASYAFNNITTNHTISTAFTINSYTLTVATAGTGSGVVTPTAGIYTHTYGTVVTLTASANTGSTFVGWGGDCSGTGSCIVTMTNTRSVTATFTLNTYTLTVATAGTGSGVVTPTVGTYTYTYGTVVTLTASANSGSAFAGWGGDCSGTGSCVVTMTNTRSVTATFTLNTYTLTVATAGTGSGVVTPTVGTYTYTYGSSVTLTASANAGSTFAGWGGDCGGAGSCVVMMTNTRSVTATFTLNTYTLTVATAGTGSGVVTPTAGIYTHTYGTVVTLTASANTGSTFAGWGGDCSGTGSCVVTMTNTRSVTATFMLNTYTLTVATAGTGSGVVTPTAGVYTHTYGTVVTLTASANTGSTFAGWSGACSGTGSCVVIMTNTHSVTATFMLNTYTITPTTSVGGAIAPSTPQTVNYGTSLAFTITPNVGYHIVDVSVDGVSQGPITNYVFPNISANHTISAVFALNTYTLTVTTAGSGSGVVTPTVGVYTYTYGTVVTLTASANAGSAFTGWGGDCSGTGSCVVTMTANRNVNATFDAIAYKIYGPFIVK